MRKELFTTVVPKEISHSLRDKDYERVTRQNVISTFLQGGGDENSSAYISYHDKLIKVTAEADLLKQDIYNEYVPKEYHDRADCVWELDYESGTLKVYKV